MKTIRFSLWILCMVLIAGCAISRSRRAEIYPMSFDQTYQVALEALDEMKRWSVVETDHLEGLITIEDPRYFRNERYVTLIVKRIDSFRTKVELYGDDTLGMADEFFGMLDTRAGKHAYKYPPHDHNTFATLDRRYEERALTYPS